MIVQPIFVDLTLMYILRQRKKVSLYRRKWQLLRIDFLAVLIGRFDTTSECIYILNAYLYPAMTTLAKISCNAGS